MTSGFLLDVTRRFVNVQWGRKGKFSFVGWIGLTETEMGQSTPHFTWLGGTSPNGETWRSSQKEEGLSFYCCVRGRVGTKFPVVAAGSVIDGPHDFGPGYSLAYGVIPAGGVSDDEGLTWKDAGIPKQKHILRPPNPITGQAAEVASGNCNAVAYLPLTQEFYVGGSVIFNKGTDVYWEDRMYSGDGSGFSLVYSERRELFVPFPGYRWPEVIMGPGSKPQDRLRVADRTLQTEPGPGVQFVVSFGPTQQVDYVTNNERLNRVARNAEGNGVIIGGEDIHPPMAVVNSVTAGKGSIVAVGWEDEAELFGPVTFVSDDDGDTWTSQLSELCHQNPGPEDDDSGSSGGSCSFS